jgi:hypothetical protein
MESGGFASEALSDDFSVLVDQHGHEAEILKASEDGACALTMKRKTGCRRPSSPARNLLTKAQPHKAAKAPATGRRDRLKDFRHCGAATLYVG